jgi:NADH:ubiquinone oxidoreductase subunit 5 (subunit L)/multisubunit Na+/H+ antiporter MnhA subunit
MSHHVELTFYRAIVLISSAATLGISIASLYYFNKIRLDGQCSPVTHGTATTMVWLNLILAILSAIAFFWSLFRLIFNGEDHDVVNESFNLHTHIHPDPDTVVVNPTASPISTIADQGFQV